MDRKKGFYHLKQAQKFMHDRIKYTNDQQYLKIVARKNPNSQFKEMAVKKIHDQKFLYEFILSSKNSWHRKTAADNLTDKNLRKKVLQNLQTDAQLFSMFLNEIEDDLELVIRCLKNMTEFRVVEKALPLFKRRKDLLVLQEYFEKQAKKKSGNWDLKKICNAIEDRIEAIPRSLDFMMGD